MAKKALPPDLRAPHQAVPLAFTVIVQRNDNPNPVAVTVDAEAMSAVAAAVTEARAKAVSEDPVRALYLTHFVAMLNCARNNEGQDELMRTLTS